jgi:hypothetical protein
MGNIKPAAGVTVVRPWKLWNALMQISIRGHDDIDYQQSEAFAIAFTGEYASLQVGKSRFHEQLACHHDGIL